MGLHVIIGEDDFLVNAAAQKLIGDWPAEIFDSRISDNAEKQLADLRDVEASFSTPPFFDPRKVTWWKNVGFLPGVGSKKELAEEVKTAMEDFARKVAANPLPENQRFIVSAPRWRSDSVFAKTLKTIAEVVEMSSSGRGATPQMTTVRVIDYAKEMGLDFSPGAAERFVGIVGTDTRSIMNELAKLRDYIGNERSYIMIADIDSVTLPGIGMEPVPWNVTDAVARRDMNAALTAIKRFESKNGFAVEMATTMTRFFRQMLDVAENRPSGMTPWAEQKIRNALRAWSISELRAARARFLRLRDVVAYGISETSRNALIITELVRAVSRPKKR